MIDYRVSSASLSNDNAENYYETIKWEKLEDSGNNDQEACRLSRKLMALAKNEEVKKWKN